LLKKGLSGEAIEEAGTMVSGRNRVETVYVTYFNSKGWKIALAASAQGLVRITFPLRSKGRFETELGRRFADAVIVENPGKLARAKRQLEEYFAGKRRTFDLTIDLGHLTPFQRRVIRAVARIPFGTTTSYGEIARRVGSPHAARAVGQVMHRNPFPIVIPCHRVIGSDGSLVGFGGGLALKASLLEHESGAAAT
jgi:O-6-methylguanine DNA methyltransferase